MTGSQFKVLLKTTLAAGAIVYVLFAAKWTAQITQQTVTDVQERIAEAQHDQGGNDPKEGFLNRLIAKTFRLPSKRQQ